MHHTAQKVEMLKPLNMKRNVLYSSTHYRAVNNRHLCLEESHLIFYREIFCVF